MAFKILKEDLEELYLNQNMSQQAIAEQLGCSIALINKKIKEFNIVKSKEQKRECRIKTDLAKYGCEHSSQAASVKEKQADSNMKSHGHKYNFQKNDFDPSGDNNSMKREDVKARQRKTNLERYGAISPLLNEDIKQRIKENNLANYGVEFSSQREDVKAKIANTNLEKYGSACSLGSLEIREKVKQTMLDKYGVEYCTQNPEIKQKVIDTCKQKYGANSYIQTAEAKEKQIATLRAAQNPLWVEAIKSKESFELMLNNNGLDTVDKMCHFFNLSSWPIYAKIKEFNLINIINRSESSLETEIKEFLDSLNIKYEKTRKVISPYELDIYCPDYKIAIEMNGDYWHSSLFKEKKYHFNKSCECEKRGIKLIHIYEHEWKDARIQPIIKSLLKISFNKVNNKIFARNCEIREISNKETKPFVDANHVQGHRNAQVTYGLFYNDSLVQIMSFSYDKKHNWWEIIRGCPKMDTMIVGGVSKLFKYFIKQHNPEQIFSYCDFNKFDGHGYEALGMSLIGLTGPDMTWILNDGRICKRSPSKNKEMKKNAVAQVWGAGSKRYLWIKN